MSYTKTYHNELNDIIGHSNQFVSEDLQEDLSDFLDSVIEGAREEGYEDGFNEGCDRGFENAREEFPSSEELPGLRAFLEEKLEENRYDVGHYDKLTRFIATITHFESVLG
jgi:hypothetical protein